MMDSKKGCVCVTGGTGFIGSWIVKMLLEDGYHVNTTSRINPECKRNISFLTSLPGASERLQIFNADLDRPETFRPAIEGCIGLFHVAHPLDFEETEPEDVKVKRVTTGLQGILQACADAKTIRRVVYTSSIAAAYLGAKTGPSGLIDESSWTDVEFVRRQRPFGGPYFVAKTLAEKAAINCADELGLDLVCVLPTMVTGSFICKHIPFSVYASMALIFADKLHYKDGTSLVHVDDVARAHIHLFEYPNAKGRYICVAVELTIEKLCELISARYPEYKMPNSESWKDIKPLKIPAASTKKLEDTGFKYENGLAEMFDDAIKSCKEKGFL
ncbi:NAD(P)-binding Rossmann-fold superfamily protein [Striga asiatica]|uniref:Dihydroflavonol 4-reductase n=1 Tax=Striga asiatica TaxID=4170 RepID=A0A5A7PQH3_STRAF|nr:NAD(P)-binding Rossmann-fold superfamily protein [Striga asiatica]